MTPPTDSYDIVLTLLDLVGGKIITHTEDEIEAEIEGIRMQGIKGARAWFWIIDWCFIAIPDNRDDVLVYVDWSEGELEVHPYNDVRDIINLALEKIRKRKYPMRLVIEF